MPWSSSDRRQRLPDDWSEIRKQVKARARGRCEAERHDPDCNGIGNECDHVIAGDNHSPDNLQWLSTACHKAKTARESQQRNQLNAQLRRRPQEQHPGRKQ